MASMVTGGTGFVGARIVRKLVERGEDVVAFDISPNFKFIEGITDKITFVQGDITNANEIMSTMKAHNIEHVYHTAFLLTSVIRVAPARAINVNGVGMVNVLEACRLMDVKRIVYTSSIRVFDGLSGDITDDSPKHVVTLYGILKRLGEIYGLEYYKAYGLDFRGVRLPGLYGAGDTYLSHEHSRIIENAALGKPSEISSSPDSTTSALYVKDAANAHIAVLGADENKVKQRIYLVEGANCLWQEYADTVRKLVPDAVINFAPKEKTVDRMFHDTRFHGTYLKEELGWKPSYTMEEGIRETMDEIRKNPQWYSKGYYVKDRYV